MKYITYSPSLSPNVYIEGLSINWTKYVLLSSNSLSNMHPLTSFTTRMGEISGIIYKNFEIQNENKIYIKIRNLPESGIYDIIAYNIAGFAKLSDTGFLIKYN